MAQQKNVSQALPEDLLPPVPVPITEGSLLPSDVRQDNEPQALPDEILRARRISTEEDRMLSSDERQSLDSTGNETSQGRSEYVIESGSYQKAPRPTRHTGRLERSRHALNIFIWYAVLAAFTWICTCIMSCRPLTTTRYGYGDKTDYGSIDAAWPNKYIANEYLYLAIQFLQAVVAVLTIPTTTAICAQGAVIYMQRNRRNGGLTLRQTIVLADKGWTDIGVLSHVLRRGWKRFGTCFLAIAVAIHVLGKKARIPHLVGKLLTGQGSLYPHSNSSSFAMRRFSCLRSMYSKCSKCVILPITLNNSPDMVVLLAMTSTW